MSETMLWGVLAALAVVCAVMLWRALRKPAAGTLPESAQVRSPGADPAPSALAPQPSALPVVTPPAVAAVIRAQRTGRPARRTRPRSAEAAPASG
jgi:hypothetical protein